MRIRLALTLDIKRTPPSPQPTDEPEPQREVDLYSSTERNYDIQPRIGFRPHTDEDA